MLSDLKIKTAGLAWFFCDLVKCSFLGKVSEGMLGLFMRKET